MHIRRLIACLILSLGLAGCTTDPEPTLDDAGEVARVTCGVLEEIPATGFDLTSTHLERVSLVESLAALAAALDGKYDTLLNTANELRQRVMIMFKASGPQYEAAYAAVHAQCDDSWDKPTQSAEKSAALSCAALQRIDVDKFIEADSPALPALRVASSASKIAVDLDDQYKPLADAVAALLADMLTNPGTVETVTATLKQARAECDQS